MLNLTVNPVNPSCGGSVRPCLDRGTREIGLGLEAQVTACQRLLQVEGLECLGIFQEVTSGKVDPNEREEFPKVIALAIEQGASLLMGLTHCTNTP